MNQGREVESALPSSAPGERIQLAVGRSCDGQRVLRPQPQPRRRFVWKNGAPASACQLGGCTAQWVSNSAIHPGVTCAVRIGSQLRHGRARVCGFDRRLRQGRRAGPELSRVPRRASRRRFCVHAAQQTGWPARVFLSPRGRRAGRASSGIRARSAVTTADEVAAGLSWYIRGHNLKLVSDVTHLNGAPINSTATNIRPSDDGWLFRTQFQFMF